MDDTDSDVIILEPELVEVQEAQSESTGQRDVDLFQADAGTSAGTQGDEGCSCTICLEPWTNTGDHRLCCLKCGHLYGRSCIVRWVKSNKRCPQCSGRARIADIRNLYVAKLMAVDNAEAEALRQQVQAVERARNIAQVHAAALGTEVKRLSASCKHLQWLTDARLLGPSTQVTGVQQPGVPKRSRTDAQGTDESRAVSSANHFRQYSSSLPGQAVLPDFQLPQHPSGVFDSSSFSLGHHAPFMDIQSNTQSYNAGSAQTMLQQPSEVPETDWFGSGFELRQKVPLDGQAQCCDMSARHALIVFPEQTAGSTAVRKVSMMNPEAKQHVRLPDDVGMVRSIILEHSAHPQHAILACTGSCIALISLTSDRVVTRVQLPVPAHSCCWHAVSTNIVYAGLQNGVVEEYDLRRAGTAMNQITLPRRLPVHSLASHQQHLSPPTLLAGSMFAAYRLWQGDWRDGSHSSWHDDAIAHGAAGQRLCTSVSVHHGSDQALVTFKQNNSCQMQHNLYRCTGLDRGWEQSHTLSSTGSFGALQPTLMSRPAGVAPGAPLLASCHETSDTIRLWDAASSGLALQSLPSCGAAVRQIRAGLTPYGALLMGLSPDHVQLYCWRANTG